MSQKHDKKYKVLVSAACEKNWCKEGSCGAWNSRGNAVRLGKGFEKRWDKLGAGNTDASDANTIADELIQCRNELKRLQKENKKLREENEILADATAFFAKSRLKSE